MAESDRTAQEVAKLARVPGTHRVSSHLYLLVRPAKKGGLRASWAFRFEQHGKATWMGLGSIKVFTLAEARERARKARQLLADKVNPLAAKRQHATAAKLEAAKALTFGEAAQQYLAKQLQGPGLGWNAKHAAQWRTTFEGSSRQGAATAAINDLPIGAIDTAMALKVLEPLIRTPETASRVRGRCEKVIDWTSARGRRTGPTRSHGKATSSSYCPSWASALSSTTPPCPMPICPPLWPSCASIRVSRRARWRSP